MLGRECIGDSGDEWNGGGRRENSMTLLYDKINNRLLAHSFLVFPCG